MTHQEAAKYINKRAVLTFLRDKLSIIVVINNLRSSYGRVEAQIEPESGSGQAWVDITSLEICNP